MTGVSSSRLAPRRAALALALAGIVLGLSALPSQAQVFFRPFAYGGSWSGPIIDEPEPMGPARLHPRALYQEIGSQGYRPLRILARGPETITVEAVDASARRVRLTVDAFDGEIVSVRPIAAAAAPPPRSNARILPVEPEAATPAPTTTPTPPRRKAAETPKATNPVAPPAASTRSVSPPAENTGPVAPARDPSQWGKQG